MLDGLRTKIAKRRFGSQVSRILKTPPLSIVPAKLTILSMVSHDDLRMYLLAIKSLYKRVGRGNIVIIDDGSLTSRDRGILETHLSGPKIIDLESVAVGRLPRHNCWERLAYALDLSAEEYVIQLDSDTLTTSCIDEVLDCVAANRAFILGTLTGQKLVSIGEASAFAATRNPDHIQFAAEKALSGLAGANGLKYVRGSAGFAGLARGGFSRNRAEDFAAQMIELMGERFLEWGTEQVAFSFFVANSPDAIVLPYPAYACLSPEIDIEQSRFLHFIGSYRFGGGIYAREGRRVISSPSAGAG